MRKAVRSTVVASAYLLFLLAGCAEVPITGRRQLNIVPASLVTSMSLQEYQQFISQSKVDTDPKVNDQVKRVATRIVQAVEQYEKEHNEKNRFAGYQWEFNVVQDPQINAFAMPGGKVVVYTGILPVAQNDAGLAAVLGHEIAHVFAEHGSERMSQALLVQMGGMGLDVALQKQPEQTRSLFNAAYGLGSQVGVLLPFSRVQESEADHLGLIFMAMAGYDPHEAVAFWQRMAAAGTGQAKPPEFLSTHPADATRIKNLENLVSEAMKYYRPGGTQAQSQTQSSTAGALQFPPVKK
jgi:predicted Zn-dependent protease